MTYDEIKARIQIIIKDEARLAKFRESLAELEDGEAKSFLEDMLEHEIEQRDVNKYEPMW